MKGLPPLPLESRPVVLLFIKPSGLTISLTEIFLGNFCRVKIVSDKKDEWLARLTHLQDNKALEILEEDDTQAIDDVNYILFVSPCIEGGSENKKLFDLAKEHGQKFTVKTLLVFSSNKSLSCQKDTLKEAKELTKTTPEVFGTVYIGQPIGPRVNLSKKNLLTRMLREAVVEGKVKVPEKETDLYPASISLTSREIAKIHFSFGGAGEEILLLSPSLSSERFYTLLKGFIPQLEREGVKESWDYEPLDLGTKRRIPFDSKKEIKETVEWFTSHPPTEVKKRKTKRETGGEQDKVQTIQVKEPKESPEKTALSLPSLKLPKIKLPKIPQTSYLNIAGLLMGLLLILLSPYLFLTAGGFGLRAATQKARVGNFSTLNRWLTFSKINFTLARAELQLLSSTPLIGGYFEESEEFTKLALEGVGVGKRIYKIGTKGGELVVKVLGDQEYNPRDYSETLTVELDAVYRDLSFLEGELYSNGYKDNQLIGGVLENIDLKDIRQKVLLARQISKELPWILGVTEERQYLILFQNNMELRPTGGFIGSFALVTFENGRLSDINVQDVYSADGQLKGHVEPPAPIKNYLGEANWYLRDSNWDPDFPVSAERAEWFLDKEIGVSVDGVVGIDLEIARDLLGVTGPIFLEDFGKEITSENMYEVTQYEVEKDFFPGSRRKANFLTAFVRELLFQLTSLGEGSHSEVARTIKTNLSEKHIQVFLHNKDAQRAISELAWDGAVYQPSCTGNCYTDYFGIVEANVGVNKANHFVERDASFIAQVENDLVKRTLTIALRNNANEGLGTSGRYKVYLRVFAPQESDFLPTEIIFGESQEFEDPETALVRGRKEAGVLVEITPGQKKSVVFRWESPADLDFSQRGEYRLIWRKQAGLDSPKISSELILPEGIEYVFEPPYSLTPQGTYSYNTDLTRDFSSRIFW